MATSNNDELAPVWQTARNKRPKPAVKPAAKPATSKRATRRPAATTRDSDVGERKLPIKAAMRLANVFLSRLGPDETEATIKTHLETTLKLDVKVELCKLSNTQSSFHITSVCANPSVFMADDIILWPVGVYRRWWRKQRTESTNTETPVETAGIPQTAAPVDSETAMKTVYNRFNVIDPDNVDTCTSYCNGAACNKLQLQGVTESYHREAPWSSGMTLALDAALSVFRMRQ